MVTAGSNRRESQRNSHNTRYVNGFCVFFLLHLLVLSFVTHFTSVANRLCFFQRLLQATTQMSCLLIQPDAIRTPVTRDHAVTHTFNYLSIPLQVTNWLPVICGWLRRANRPPDLPARLGTPVDLRSTSIRGRGFAAYLSACGGQLLNVRCAHYAGGASLTTFGFVTIVPRYFATAK